MSMNKSNLVTVTLYRDGFRTQWGFRLVGGADLGAPLQIQRVFVGTPSEGELHRGDVIRKIGEYDARRLSHQDAQALFMNSGNNITLVVQRGDIVLPKQPVMPVVPQTPKPPIAGGVATPFLAAGQRPPGAPAFATLPRRAPPAVPPAAPATPPLPTSSFSNVIQRPMANLPVTVFPPPMPLTIPNQYQYDEWEGEEWEKVAVTQQPYRTTPLVLPGAKAKKDNAVTQSYLQHHPNPAMRAPPSHFGSPADYLMKQKVADTVLERVAGQEIAAGKQIVHKQFNSPINLYSDQNIAETIATQTGVTPQNSPRQLYQAPMSPKSPALSPRPSKLSYARKPTVVYDPQKSETFKALREAEFDDRVHEVTIPVQQKIFTPTRIQPARKPAAQQDYKPAIQQDYINSLGQSDERIQQSNSFRRLMAEVLGETEF